MIARALLVRPDEGLHPLPSGSLPEAQYSAPKHCPVSALILAFCVGLFIGSLASLIYIVSVIVGELG